MQIVGVFSETVVSRLLESGVFCKGSRSEIGGFENNFFFSFFVKSPGRRHGGRRGPGVPLASAGAGNPIATRLVHLSVDRTHTQGFCRYPQHWLHALIAGRPAGLQASHSQRKYTVAAPSSPATTTRAPCSCIPSLFPRAVTDGHGLFGAMLIQVARNEAPRKQRAQAVRRNAAEDVGTQVAFLL